MAATTSQTRKKRPARPRLRESLDARKARAAKILQLLEQLYPGATCALHHDSALHLLAATILSAQCTDDRVNMVTPALFRRYRSARDFADADQAELENLIKSTGFFRNKAKNLIGMGRALCEKNAGEVPDTMDELLHLPGVARKTANVVLGTWFGRNEGVVVDTHIGRVSTRLGLAPAARDSKDAIRIELDLMQVFPQEEWTNAGHYMIWHGRKVCLARRPACERCTLSTLCPSAFLESGEAPPRRNAAATKISGNGVRRSSSAARKTAQTGRQRRSK